MAFNRQEAFDKAAKGVIEQGGPAFDKLRQGCSYRVPGTSLKCGVGHMIPDEAYTGDDMEVGIGAVLAGIATPRQREAVLKVLAAVGATFADAPFLKDIQAAHDTAPVPTFVASFYREMQQVAYEYGLSLDVLDQAYADHCAKQQALAA